MCKWKELAIAAGFVYLLWKYGKDDDDGALSDPSDSQQKQLNCQMTKSANDPDEDVVSTLRRLRDEEKNLIRYCVFDLAMLESSQRLESWNERDRDIEVIHNPQRYADLTMTEESLQLPSQRAKVIGCNEGRPSEQIRQEIAHLRALIYKERNTILHCVYERAMQERQKNLNNQSYGWNCYVINQPHKFA